MTQENKQSGTRWMFGGTDGNRSKEMDANASRKHYTAAQLSHAKLKLNRAERWRRANPGIWAFIVREALADREAGRPISGHRIIAEARRKDWVDSEGNTSGVNNDYAAVVTRWLIAEYPDMAELIERRGSVFDVVMMPCAY